MPNTIDVLGDDITARAFIDGTITEFVDDELNMVGNSAFSGCSQLASIDLPEATSIKSSAFISCTQLTSVNLPKATSIGDSAFNGCSQLTSVDLPKATSIKSSVFYFNCPKLASVIIRTTTAVCTLASTNVFTGAPNAVIYVPDDKVDDYKAATNWSKYASRIKGLSELPVS